ncbi:hypothetical protein [Belliella aquatica]|uniref:hypothetical protein n=1 Tax=Belliella aquatica TaxID=1323734 RepID=UPI00166D0C07|nr:hypothetical protein [Belliella aquatica]
MKSGLKNQYLWVVFVLGVILLNYPILAIYNIPEVWFGIPVLFFFVFLFWLLLILATFLIILKLKKKDV